MTAVTSPASSSVPFSWPIVNGGHVATIYTVSADNYPAAAAALQAWKGLYETFNEARPDNTTSGATLAGRLITNISTGIVFVAESSDKSLHAMARGICCPDHFFVQELVVAPWFNPRCMDAFSGNQDALLEAEVMDNITIPTDKGTGTLMAYGLCKYALAHDRKCLSLIATEDTNAFFAGLGFTLLEGSDNVFIGDLSTGIPQKLVDRVHKYFPTIVLS